LKWTNEISLLEGVEMGGDGVPPSALDGHSWGGEVVHPPHLGWAQLGGGVVPPLTLDGHKWGGGGAPPTWNGNSWGGVVHLPLSEGKLGVVDIQAFEVRDGTLYRKKILVRLGGVP